MVEVPGEHSSRVDVRGPQVNSSEKGLAMTTREVWKLGGTSLDSAEKRAQIGEKVAAERDKDLVVVVSAASGVTDYLLRSAPSAQGVSQDVIDAYVAAGELASAALVAASIQECGRP